MLTKKAKYQASIRTAKILTWMWPRHHQTASATLFTSPGSLTNNEAQRDVNLENISSALAGAQTS